MLLINEFDGVEIGCPNITTNGTSIKPDCKFKTGADVLEFYHVDPVRLKKILNQKRQFFSKIGT